ncbi:P2Y purinoceptor 12-like [Lineus longissimus]|uniref:P2Y purinoceptor 12-like n=1 Tax=Lineus longissimus TaxID=88925 RepID=UPI00315D2104
MFRRKNLAGSLQLLRDRFAHIMTLETFSISLECSTTTSRREETSTLFSVFTVVNFIIVIIIPPVLAVVGGIGNFLSFLLMNQPKYSKSTTCFYMRCLAKFDSVYIFGRMILRYLLVVASNILLEQAVETYFCLFYLSVFYFGCVLSPLLLTIMAIDRFVALTWPLKAANVCTMRRSKQLVFGTTSLGAVLGLIQLLRSHRPELISWYCPYHFKVAAGVFDQVFNVVTAYIPIICLLFCNLGIIRAVYKSKRELSHLSNTKRSSSTEKSITSTTVMVTCIFIISKIPMLFEDSFWSYNSFDPTSKLIVHLKILSINFAILMESLNYCLNFYMYGLSCKRFRKELLIIIMCRYKTLQKSTRSKVLSTVT